MVKHSAQTLDSVSASFKSYYWVFCIAAIINLGIWILMSADGKAYLQIDSYDYLSLGQSIFKDLNFPSSFRTPVFPFFVGFWESLLGFSIKHYVLVQIGVALINIYLLGRLASYFLSVKLQVLIMLVFALDIVTAQVANYVLAETVFSFLLLLALNFLCAARKYIPKDEVSGSSRQTNKYALLCGITLGLFALCRPVGQFIPLILIVWYIFFKPKQVSIKSQWFVLLSIAMCSFLSIQAWKLNNYVNKGQYFTSVTMSYNIYNYRAAWNVAYRDGKTFEEVKDEFHDKRDAYKASNPQLSEYDISQHFTDIGLDIILDTPKETVFQAIRGLVFLYGGIYNGSLDRVFQHSIAKKAAQAYTLLYNVLIYLGIFICLCFIKRLDQRERSIVALSALVVAYFTFFSIGVESYARLRAPFIPYLVLIAAIGWMKLYQYKFKQETI